MSDEIAIRSKEIMDKNLPIEILIERLVLTEMDLKNEKFKVEQCQMLLALEAVDRQKLSDPTYIDIESDEYIDAYNEK